MARDNIHTTPELTVCRLKGDHMHHGYIDNSNRPSRLEVVVKDGVLYGTDHDGYVHWDALPVTDGEIVIGSDWTFLPDRGELVRIGVLPEVAA